MTTSKGPPSLPTPAALPSEIATLARKPPAPVTALRVFGTAHAEIALPAKRSFVLGAAKGSDVHVSSTMLDASAPERVSRAHLLIERKGNGLYVKDQGSTNGTQIDGYAASEGYLDAGIRLTVGNVTLLAMDDLLRELRKELHWALGLHAHATVDQVLADLRGDRPLVLIGAPHCEQRRLTEAIHAASSRRARPFMAVPARLGDRGMQIHYLASADQGTVLVELPAEGTLSAFFVGELFGRTYNVRPIFLARNAKVIAENLQGYAKLPYAIPIPTIAERRDDVPDLLSAIFEEPPLRSRRDAHDLGPEVVAQLCAFDWPDNFADLRRNAPRILAFLEHGKNEAATARALGLGRSTLRDALHRIGIRVGRRRSR